MSEQTHDDNLGRIRQPPSVHRFRDGIQIFLDTIPKTDSTVEEVSDLIEIQELDQLQKGQWTEQTSEHREKLDENMVLGEEDNRVARSQDMGESGNGCSSKVEDKTDFKVNEPLSEHHSTLSPKAQASQLKYSDFREKAVEGGIWNPDSVYRSNPQLIDTMFGIIKSPDEKPHAEVTLESESSINELSAPYSGSTSLLSSIPEAHGTPTDTKVHDKPLLSDRPVSNQKPQYFLILTSSIASAARPRLEPQDDRIKPPPESRQEPRAQVHSQARSLDKLQLSFLQRGRKTRGKERELSGIRESQASGKAQTSSKTGAHSLYLDKVALHSENTPEPRSFNKAQNSNCDEKNTHQAPSPQPHIPREKSPQSEISRESVQDVDDAESEDSDLEYQLPELRYESDGASEMTESWQSSATSHRQNIWSNPHTISQIQQYDSSYLSPGLPPHLLYTSYTSNEHQQLRQPYPHWQDHAGLQPYVDTSNQLYYGLAPNADVSPLLISSPLIYPHTSLPARSSLVDRRPSSFGSSRCVQFTENSESSEPYEYPAYRMPVAESFQTQGDAEPLRSLVVERSPESLRNPRTGRSRIQSPGGGNYSQRTSRHKEAEKSGRLNQKDDTNQQQSDSIQENAGQKADNSKVCSAATVSAEKTEDSRDRKEIKGHDEEEVSSGSVVEFKARRTVRDQEQVEEFEFKFVFKK
ncbi:hypothetical protein F4806DRAFT_491995 [Annulohypoxylon nitens]|nr:hypothetical protein F4806DRAFT_491995 [Annulohypoxylon nitens]